jgi:hypothetical protein
MVFCVTIGLYGVITTRSLKKKAKEMGKEGGREGYSVSEGNTSHHRRRRPCSA